MQTVLYWIGVAALAHWVLALPLIVWLGSFHAQPLAVRIFTGVLWPLVMLWNLIEQIRDEYADRKRRKAATKGAA